MSDEQQAPVLREHPRTPSLNAGAVLSARAGGAPRRARAWSAKRGLAVAALALAVLPAAAACSAGADAETTQIKPNTVEATIGDIQVQDIVMVQSDGPGSAAALTAAAINTGATPDTLLSISVQGGPDATLIAPGPTVPPGAPTTLGPRGPITIPAQSAIYFAGGGTGLSSPAIASFSSLPPTVTAGSLVTLTFTFSDAGSITTTTPVQSAQNNPIYQSVTPLAAPSGVTPPATGTTATPAGGPTGTAAAMSPGSPSTSGSPATAPPTA